MLKKVLCLSAFLLLAATPAFAQTPTAQSVQGSVDGMWVMTAALLVFFMHAGFAMVESGFTRSKNTLNILMKNFLTISIASILYFLVGFGLMFGSTANGLTGTDGFLLAGREDIGFFVFQAVFAATCATIISGAVAERMKLRSYMLITVVITGLIYPVVGHWVWGGGWLSELGFVDFAGSTVVHLSGAVAAFIAVLFLGPRIGKYTNSKVNVIPGHNIPIGALGVFILWFGWFGFNGGSTLTADPDLVPRVITATLLSASAAVLSSAFYTAFRFNRIDPSLTLNGALGGLVGITAGCANVSIGGSIVIGLAAGILLVEGVRFIEVKLKVDDPVGAIAVHGLCGIWGTLAIGFFDVSNGLFYGGGLSLLGTQAIGVGAVILWVAASSGAVIYLVNKADRIRVSSEDELAGLDFSEHGATAYELSETVLTSHSNQPNAAFGKELVRKLDGLSVPASKKQYH
ncbi:ammonium transporter [Rossellomorea vietnamensis]|uniref:Ammonium transporter n=1 Tax=Rossellomorea vietnamensis TaxID=218284 RepID=A0A5D4MEN8_9BACI|nr:ammonium transporter [Rossellomorea vietnamensis]TYR99460.1 ammonium transporter [Rossellomorea vietnamensis]